MWACWTQPRGVSFKHLLEGVVSRTQLKGACHLYWGGKGGSQAAAVACSLGVSLATTPSRVACPCG